MHSRSIDFYIHVSLVGGRRGAPPRPGCALRGRRCRGPAPLSLSHLWERESEALGEWLLSVSIAFSISPSVRPTSWSPHSLSLPPPPHALSLPLYRRLRRSLKHSKIETPDRPTALARRREGALRSGRPPRELAGPRRGGPLGGGMVQWRRRQRSGRDHSPPLLLSQSLDIDGAHPEQRRRGESPGGQAALRPALLLLGAVAVVAGAARA